MQRKSYKCNKFEIKKSIVRNPMFVYDKTKSKDKVSTKKIQTDKNQLSSNDFVMKGQAFMNFETSIEHQTQKQKQNSCNSPFKHLNVSISPKKNKSCTNSNKIAQKTLKKLDFFHCDGLVIRSKAAKNICQDLQISRIHDNILPQKQFNEKRSSRLEKQQQIKVKRRSIFNNIGKSRAFEKLQQIRKAQNKAFQQIPEFLANQKYHITFQTESIAACCI